ncbi:MAG TPA: hypothetical protein VLF20_00365 [Patescibacteria group bacterium]|nr:hypothetical protein [Patescibacteria group bacterium]
MVSLLFEIIAFLIFIITCLYLPGRLLFAKLRLKIETPGETALATGVGLLLFTLVAYIFSWLHADFFILPFFLIVSFFAIKNKLLKSLSIRKEHVKPFVLVSTLALFFSLTMLVTGKFGDTIIYRHDDPWHLALITELKSHFPPDNPAIAGVPLKGYHFFYNFVLATISNLFLISPISLHFHFFPLLISFLWAFGVYSLLFVWTKKISAALWAVFLTMFGGSFAFILVLQGHPEVDLNSGMGITQPAFSLYNPPFAISIVIILLALFAMHQYLTTKQKSWLVPLVLAVGLVSMFKVYAGMLLMGGIVLLAFFSLIKKNYYPILALIGSGVLFFFTYLIFNGNAGSLIWHPWWPVSTLLQHFSWYGYDEKMYTYTQLGVIRGIIETQAYGFSLVIFGNLGTRILGILMLVFLFFKKPKFPSVFSIIVAAMAFAGILTPLLFLQSGKVFEIIQIAWYYLFLCSLFAAIGFSRLFAFSYPTLIKVLLFIIVIPLTIPSTYSTYQAYLTIKNSERSMTTPYFQTLAYLAAQGTYDDTVLEMPPKHTNPDDWSINAWYYQSDPSIVAFANKRSFLNNEFIAFPGIDLETRMDTLKKLVSFQRNLPSDGSPVPSPEKIRELLLSNNISFIVASYDASQFTKIKNITKIYQNGEYRIYKISPQ